MYFSELREEVNFVLIVSGNMHWFKFIVISALLGNYAACRGNNLEKHSSRLRLLSGGSLKSGFVGITDILQKVERT